MTARLDGPTREQGMIITRTPLRITLGGGGTDLPGYYREHDGGFLVAAAITKYVYVAVHPTFDGSLLLKYSDIERAETVDDIEHPLIREALRFTGIVSGIEISSMADIPAGTGLGSSGTFTVGLLRALRAHQRRFTSQREIAREACHLEIDVLREPVGRQDQYIAAVGGLSALTFNPDDTVEVQSVDLAPETRIEFEENLVLFYTGVRRSASAELRALDEGTTVRAPSISKNLDDVKASGYATLQALEKGDLIGVGEAMTDQWKLKLARAPSAIHDEVDGWIEAGCRAGAVGGKLVGAGGGGFLLFYAEQKGPLRRAMSEFGLTEVRMGIDYLGSTVTVS